MSDSTKMQGSNLGGDSSMLESTRKIMEVALVVFCFVVVIVVVLHLYARWFWSRHLRASSNHTAAAPATRRRRRFDFAAGHQEVALATIHCRGLDPSILRTLPVVEFSQKDFKDGLECAVCLCEVCDGEKARILPKCNHGFHMDCIDMWLNSHSTCPLCRSPVSGQPSWGLDHGSTAATGGERRSFPTNLLLWGDETHITIFGAVEDVNICLNSQFHSSPVAVTSSSVSSSSPFSAASDANNRSVEILAIDIPGQANDEEPSMSSMTPRMRSLGVQSVDQRSSCSSH